MEFKKNDSLYEILEKQFLEIVNAKSQCCTSIKAKDLLSINFLKKKLKIVIGHFLTIQPKGWKMLAESKFCNNLLTISVYKFFYIFLLASKLPVNTFVYNF